MPRKPQPPPTPPPPPPPLWDIYKAAAKLRLLGTTEATDVRKAIAKAAEQFKVPTTTLVTQL